ncbi:DHCW motif cupin fold protein [Azospirillum sp. INR13]|uniref:DHCW motif cupin fold protein n=1 Tax=Azospirillum sp. INR13 TaxID=2596919 RepID=UPI00351C4D22
MRLVEYTPGYLADHWCDRGHVLFVVSGELITELKDGRRFVLTAGNELTRCPISAITRTGPSTEIGATLFIVD